MPPSLGAGNPQRRATGEASHWRPLPWKAFGAPLLLALVATTLAGQALAPKARSIPELKAFFQQNCIRCHGLDGSARGPEGQKLGGLDFTKAAQDFRLLEGPGSEREIRKMAKTIRKGILFGRIMPAWKDLLSQDEAGLMVRQVLLYAERGKPIEP